MTLGLNSPPITLIAGPADPSLAAALQAQRCGVVQVPTGLRVLEWARDIQPDLILVRSDLPDMSAVEACEMLRRDPRIGHNTPILILTADRPSPEQRVTAVSAGAWDFLRHPGDPKELAVKVQSYVQAKHNLDRALADGLVDPVTGLHNRIGLARRARELGALMGRKHGALGCIVFALDAAVPDLESASLVARSTRVSDVVGALSPAEFAVLAPGTDGVGMVQLALRVGHALSNGANGRVAFVPGTNLRAGYDAVANFTYAPMDPVELLGRASTAVRTGKPETDFAWVRRYEDSGPSGRASPAFGSPEPLRRVVGKEQSGV